MRAVVTLDFTTTAVAEVQERLLKLGKELQEAGVIATYSFDVAGPEGRVTEKCVLREGRVVA